MDRRTWLAWIGGLMPPSWFDRLLPGFPATPAPQSGAKPSSPVAPFPQLTPQQVRDARWERRFRRLLRTGVQPALQEFPQILLAAMLLNQFGAEDYWPDEKRFARTLLLSGGGNNSLQFVNQTNDTLIITELVAVTRTVSAGLVFLGPIPGALAGALGTSPGVILDSRAFPALSLSGLDVSTVANPIMFGVTGISAGLGLPSGINISPALFTSPQVVAPGRGLAMAAQGNEVISATVVWREVPLPLAVSG